MATNNNAPQTKTPEMSQKGLEEVLNAGTTFENPAFKVASRGYLEATGVQNKPAMLIDTSSLPVDVSGGLTSLEAAQRAYQAGFKTEAETAGQLYRSGQVPMQENYNTNPLFGRAVTNARAGVYAAAQAVSNVVEVGVFGGQYKAALENDSAENFWASLASQATQNGDKAFENFSKNTGIYEEFTRKVEGAVIEDGVSKPGEVKEISFQSLDSFNDSETYATLDLSRLRVREADGSFRELNAEEKEWAERYQNLNRTRVADKNKRDLAAFFGDEIAETASWWDTKFDAKGNAYTKGRAYSNVIGSAVGSALLYEVIGAGPVSLVNLGTKAVKAGSIARALNTAKASWGKSVWTNPYFFQSASKIADIAGSSVPVFASTYVSEFVDARNTALAAGWDNLTAGSLASKQAFINAGIETVGFEMFMKPFLFGSKSLYNFIMATAAPQGLEEVAQTGVNTYFNEKYGITNQTMQEIVGDLYMSFIGGVSGSLFVGAVHAATNPRENSFAVTPRNSSGSVSPTGDSRTTKEWVDTVKSPFTRRPSDANPSVENQTIEAQVIEDQTEEQLQLVDQQKDYVSDLIHTQMSIEQARDFAKFLTQNDENFAEMSASEKWDALAAYAGADVAEYDKADSKDYIKMAIAVKRHGSELAEDSADVNKMESQQREAVLDAARKEYERRVKRSNKNVTKAQLDSGWEITSKILRNDMETQDLTMALAKEAEENYALLKTSQDFAQATRDKVFKAFQRKNDAKSTATLRKALSADSLERYDAQWDIATENFKKRVVKATGNRKLAEALGTLIKTTFYQDLLNTPEINPMVFMEQLSPDIVSQASLRRWKIKINGLTGIADIIQPFSSNDWANNAYNGQQARILYQLIEQYRNTDDEQQKEQLVPQIQHGLFGEVRDDFDMEDTLAFLDKVAYEETMIRRYIAVNGMNADFTTEDQAYIAAIMRLKGASEAKIMAALGIQQSWSEEECDLEYTLGINEMFPYPTDWQIDNLKKVGQRILEMQNGEDTTGAYFADDAGMGVYLSDAADNETVTHEILHWARDIGRAVAQFDSAQALTALGAKQDNGTYGPSLDGPAENSYLNTSMASFYYNLNQMLKERLGKDVDPSPAQIEETAVEFILRYLTGSMRDANPQLVAAFNGVLQRKGSEETSIDSLYSKLTIQDKTELKKELNKKFANQALERSQQLLTEARDLEQAMFDARKNINNASEEAAGNQIYNSLVKYLSGRTKNIGALNKTMSNLVKIHGQQKASGDVNNQGPYIAEIMRAANDLRAKGWQNALDALFLDSRPDSPENVGINVPGAELSGSDENNARMYFETRKRQKRKESETDRGPETRTDTQIMRSDRTVTERVKETMSLLSPKSFSKAISPFLNSLSDYANKVHPKLGAIVKSIGYEHARRKTYVAEMVYHWLNCFERYNKWSRENGKSPITEEQFQYYKNQLITHNRSSAFEVMEDRMSDNPEIQADLIAIHKHVGNALENAYQDMIMMGYDIERIDEYFPAMCIDTEGLANAIYEKMLEEGRAIPEYQKFLEGHSESKVHKLLRKAILREAEKGRDNFDPLAVINSVNAALADPHGSEAPHMHHTVLKRKPVEWNKFYKDPFDSLVLYMEDVNNKLFNWRLTGKVSIVQGVDNAQTLSASGAVGRFFADLNTGNIKGAVYNKEAQDMFTNALYWALSRSGDEANFWTELKNLQFVLTLGHIGSFINQFLELVPTMMRYGLGDTFRSAMKLSLGKSDLNIFSIGMQALNEPYRTDSKGALSKLGKWLVNANGFVKADIFNKNVVVLAAMTHAQQSAIELANGENSRSARRFMRYFNETFANLNDAQRQQVLQDMREGKVTEPVMLYLRNALAMTQPLDVTEVPAAYNRNGAMGRSMWFLSTVQLKQMGHFINELKSAWVEGGVADAGIEIVKFLAFSAMIGVPTDWLKDLIRGRQPNIKESAFYAPLQFFMVNKYFNTTGAEKGHWSTMMNRFTIQAALLDDITRASYRFVTDKKFSAGDAMWLLTKDIPIVRLAYDWEGPGYQQKRRHGEALNTREDLTRQLFTKQSKRTDIEFFGWKI